MMKDIEIGKRITPYSCFDLAGALSSDSLRATIATLAPANITDTCNQAK
jgi:hypothetical protein